LTYFTDNLDSGDCDLQGVRREVGIHARTMNKLLLQLHINSLHSKHRDALINSQPGSSNPPKVGHEKSLVSQETTANACVAVKSEGKIRQSDEKLLSSDLFSEDEKEISKLVADGFLPLKESVGHTEVEVVAGGLLGFLVGLAVYNFK
jgi:acid phosphatase family membrane protein YuiD